MAGSEIYEWPESYGEFTLQLRSLEYVKELHT